MPSLECWPYHDVKEKNEFKRVVQTCLTHLVELRLLSPSYLKAGNVINVAKGPDTWALLRATTDIALRQAILHFQDNLPVQEPSSSSSSSSTSSSMINENSENHPPDAQAENRFMSVSLSDLDNLSKDELAAKIKLELAEIHTIVDIYSTNQASQRAYLNELQTRLKKSLKNTENLEKNMKKLLSESTAMILSEEGQRDRAAIIEKLNNSIVQLQSLSESKLFIRTKELLQQEAANTVATVKKTPSTLSFPL